MTAYIPIILATWLSAMAMAACLIRDWRIKRAAFALFLDWLLLEAVVTVTGDNYPWLFNAAADWLAVLAIALPPWLARICHMPAGTGRIGGMISILYGIELIAHSAYGLGPKDDWARYHYYWTTLDVAIAQAVLMLLWEVKVGGGRVGRRNAASRVGGGSVGCDVALCRTERVR